MLDQNAKDLDVKNKGFTQGILGDWITFYYSTVNLQSGFKPRCAPKRNMIVICSMF